MMWAYLLIFFFSSTVLFCSSASVSCVEWANYKATFMKSYQSLTKENNARYNYAVSRKKITCHNNRFDKGLELYRLEINQFSDLDLKELASLFPQTTEIPTNAIPFTIPNFVPQPSFSYADIGISSFIQDQGLYCNSGWAYATATALQINAALITSDLRSVTLSAQNLIDCAGGSKACVSQVPQSAFDFLTLYQQTIFPVSVYPNRPMSGQGSCILPPTQVSGVKLSAYETIPDGDDDALKFVVNYVAPVVLKYNPASFEFLHYKEGIFTQPEATYNAAHYLTIVGYGTDQTVKKDYWIVQNSFGINWGERGYMRIKRNPLKPIANAAMFPIY